MGIHTEERVINGIRLITTTLPALDAAIVWFRLGKVISPALVALRMMSIADKAKLVKAIADVDVAKLDFATIGEIVGAFGPALSQIFERVDIAEIPTLFRGLFGTTIAVRDGAKFELGRSTDQINGAFDGDTGAMFLAAFWVGSHNFKSFTNGRRASDVTPSTAASDWTSAT